MGHTHGTTVRNVTDQQSSESSIRTSSYFTVPPDVLQQLEQEKGMLATATAHTLIRTAHDQHAEEERRKKGRNCDFRTGNWLEADTRLPLLLLPPAPDPKTSPPIYNKNMWPRVFSLVTSLLTHTLLTPQSGPPSPQYPSLPSPSPKPSPSHRHVSHHRPQHSLRSTLPANKCRAS